MLSRRLVQSRNDIHLGIVARHDDHTQRVGAATLSGSQEQGSTDGRWIGTSRADEMLQVCRMQDRPHTIRTEQENIPFNQWHSRGIIHGSGGYGACTNVLFSLVLTKAVARGRITTLREETRHP